MTRRYLHKRTIFVIASIVALLLSACGSSSEPEGLPTKVAPVAAAQQEAATAVPVATETPAPTVAPTEPPAPTETTAVDTSAAITETDSVTATSTVSATEVVTSATAVSTTATVTESVAPRIFFRQPTNNAILPLTSTVIIGVEGLTVEPAGDVKEGSGHLHLLIDSDFVPAGEAIPKDAQHIHLGSGALMTDVVLTPGPHILRLQFADGAHVALEGDEYRAQIEVEAKADAPAQSVRIVSPEEGATVTSPFTVTMAATGLIVEPAGETHDGAGHLHLLVDSDFIAPGNAIPKDETHLHYGKGQVSAELSLAPGKHTLRLQFADGAHVALEGKQYEAEVTVEVK